jgi:Fic family protein
VASLPVPPNTAVPYLLPADWIAYDKHRVFQELVDAKAAVSSLKAIPHQRDWVEKLQEIQLKMEVAGTSRIEGADFTENELDAALRPSAQAEDLLTRSQRQAHAAVQTYRWIGTIPDDRPVTEDLIREIHARMVTGCDDDHCPPGRLRGPDQNVTFGYPRHRGCEGGKECEQALKAVVWALNHEFRGHDPLVQAAALHYHFAAMHPFLDGNGRTARALEALLLQRAGLRDTAFIAMSNYYYEENPAYLAALAEVRRQRHDLTPFLAFALRGVRIQCERLFREITINVKKALFRNMMYDLFPRLKTPRKTVIAKRQVEILKLLLERDMPIGELGRRMSPKYEKLKNPVVAAKRDLDGLWYLGAIEIDEQGVARVNLDWPTQITESEFMARVKRFPKTKSHGFLSSL